MGSREDQVNTIVGWCRGFANHPDRNKHQVYRQAKAKLPPLECREHEIAVTRIAEALRLCVGKIVSMARLNFLPLLLASHLAELCPPNRSHHRSAKLLAVLDAGVGVGKLHAPGDDLGPYWPRRAPLQRGPVFNLCFTARLLRGGKVMQLITAVTAIKDDVKTGVLPRQTLCHCMKFSPFFPRRYHYESNPV